MTITKQQIDQWGSDVDYWRKKYADLGLQYDALVHQAAQPDCRTCVYRTLDREELDICCQSQVCTNGDKYIEAPKVVLWRTEP